MSKANNLKARIQGKKTPAEAFIETGLLNNSKEEKQQIISNNSNDENIDIDIDVNDYINDDIIEDENAIKNIDINNDIDTIDLNALRQKVKKELGKEKNIRFEDQHKKLTVWVKNDAFEALQLLAANKKGEKTRIVTEALMKYASEYLSK
ncbi:hypothetical protein [Metabacillus fastidiosus]|uniref:hypothetical protein n=1 Tax=Metabacillus fastidiosus TaxID=1458 RepID=UPI003D2DAB2D